MAERFSDAALGWVTNTAETPVTGRLATAEVGSAISRLRRRGRLNDTDARAALSAIDLWFAHAVAIVEHRPEDFRLAAMLVRQPDPKLLSPDALHLATSQRLGTTMVTFDEGLVVAAKSRDFACVSPQGR